MLRLSILACLVIYVALTILSEHSVANADEVSPPPVIFGRNMDQTRSISDVFVTADGRRLPISAVIDPGRRTATSDPIPQVATARRPRAVATDTAQAPSPTPRYPLAEVTGDVVNLRAGPSTADPVIAALRQGEQVELLGATGDGWAHIRAVPNGREGFMSVRFLHPVN